MPEARTDPILRIQDLAVGFAGTPVQANLSFDVEAGSIFAVMGASGSGKSTLLKALIGLVRPLSGSVHVNGEDYWAAGAARRATIDQRFGVLFQSCALWSSMTVAENVALPLRMLSAVDEPSIEALTRVKLDLVGLGGAGAVMPSDLSGGMMRRAALARALALDPAILFLDEPSAGLDPVTAKRLDDLILELRDGFGMTVVIVSHDLPSLFDVCDSGVFLDAETHTAIAHGAPAALRDSSVDPTVTGFMHRARAAQLVTGKGDTHDAS